MKKSMQISLFLALSLLFAGCVGTEEKAGGAPKAVAKPIEQRSNDPVSVKQDLRDLLHARAKEYKVSYTITVSLQGIDQKKDSVVYVKDTRQMAEGTVETSGVKRHVRTYVLDGRSVLCELYQEKWACYALPSNNSLVSTPDKDVETMEAAMEKGSVERAPARTVAGVQTDCYRITVRMDKGPIKEWIYVYCGSADGVPLYTEAEISGLKMTQEATEYSKTVDESVFTLPADITDVKGNPEAVKRQTPPPSPIKTFMETGDAVCKENGKPVVRLYSTTTCPHSDWIKDTFDSEMKKYVAQGKIVAHHWQLDTMDDTLTDVKETKVPASEIAIYQKYNAAGGVPTFIFGCEYYRIGNGYESQDDLEAEKREFAALIDAISK